MFDVDETNVMMEKKEKKEEEHSSGLGFWLEGMRPYDHLLLALMEGLGSQKPPKITSLIGN